MEEIISLFANDIKGEGFTKKEIIMVNAVALAMIFVAVVGGSLLS